MKDVNFQQSESGTPDSIFSSVSMYPGQNEYGCSWAAPDFQLHPEVCKHKVIVT